MRRTLTLLGLAQALALAGCPQPTNNHMDVPNGTDAVLNTDGPGSADVQFAGGYDLPQSGQSDCGDAGVCAVTVQVASSIHGYIVDVTGAAIVNSEPVTLGCSFMVM